MWRKKEINTEMIFKQSKNYSRKLIKLNNYYKKKMNYKVKMFNYSNKLTKTKQNY